MTRGRKIVTNILASIIGVGIVVFIISRIFGYVRGPIVSQTEVTTFQHIEQYSFNFIAETKNTAQAYINDLPVSLSETGTIQQIIALQPGMNHIELVLQDPFKKTRRYEYSITTPAFSLEEFNENEGIVEEALQTSESSNLQLSE